MIRPVHALLALVFASALAAQGKNLLFYGNSYTFYNNTVWTLVELIATEAGHPTPTVVAAHAGGQNLTYHATDPGQVAAIGNSLSPGQTWDHVIMQGHSLEATYGAGNNPMLFRSAAVAIMNNVRAHSPAARGVMYQTWARAWGHMYYPIPWADPSVMHGVVRGNYHLAVADIESAFGPGAAVNSAVGDGIALLEWDPAYYDPDKSHPGPAMTLLAAMCIYTSIYERTVCEVDPAFAPPGPLAQAIATQGLGEADWQAMAGIADRCADPAVRRFPGSGDHLLLESGTPPGFVSACPGNRMTVGTSVLVHVRSLNGAYDNALAWMLVDAFPTGSPPGPSAVHPEIQVDLGTMAILLTAADLTSPLSLSIQMPFSWPGTSVLVQGLAWLPSPETGNPFFTATDGHEFAFF